MITAVNGNFLIEPVLRTDQENKELRERLEKSGLLMPDNANRPDNKTKFEGVPNQGIIRYMPEGYAGELKVGMHVVFDENTPQGLKYEGMTLFAIKDFQIVAVVLEAK